jgi:hypothetical protein
MTSYKLSTLVATALEGGPYINGAGASSTETMYVAGIGNSGSVNSFIIRRYSGGSFTDLATVNPNTLGITLAAATLYRIKLRGEGSGVLKAKLWADGTPEPAAWTLTATDGSPLSAGHAGVFAFAAAAGGSINHDFDWFTYALSGDSAPEPF